ncbi:uncharacterized protein LOC119707462 [Motacilla alba alba]|uniref:uncharacterized protein LOC119707462 n=1 Tax=Motacilla alba alba TaxID=1094192 RepID=UPI0018D58761|nr:uncharacterized protein LOC119707462 [Motacilla alba alba]
MQLPPGQCLGMALPWDGTHCLGLALPGTPLSASTQGQSPEPALAFPHSDKEYSWLPAPSQPPLPPFWIFSFTPGFSHASTGAVPSPGEVTSDMGRKGEQGMNCREFSPCSQGLWHCTGETRPGSAPGGREGRQFHLLQRATQEGSTQDRTNPHGQPDSTSSTSNTDTTGPDITTHTRSFWDPLLSPWGKVTVPALPGGEGHRQTPNATPPSHRGVPTALGCGCAACGNPGAFQEAVPAWTQSYPGGSPALLAALDVSWEFPALLATLDVSWEFPALLATLDAGLRSPTAAGAHRGVSPPQDQTPPRASSTGGSGDTCP